MNWSELFPLNTFHGETKQQILDLLQLQKQTIIDNLNNELKLQGNSDGLTHKYQEIILNS